MKRKRGPSSSREKEDATPAEGDFEEGSWECTVCTYRNTQEAFKCEMCDTRKGTSTRKPRLNPIVVQQQTLVQNLAVQQNAEALKRQRNPNYEAGHPDCATASTSRATRAAAEEAMIRSSPKKRPITVDGVTITITEFKPRTSPRGRKRIM